MAKKRNGKSRIRKRNILTVAGQNGINRGVLGAIVSTVGKQAADNIVKAAGEHGRNMVSAAIDGGRQMMDYVMAPPTPGGKVQKAPRRKPNRFEPLGTLQWII